MLANGRARMSTGGRAPRKQPEEPPAPERADADADACEGERFDVEAFLDVRWKNKGEQQYRVKWEGYPTSKATWQRAGDLEKDLGAAFFKLVEAMECAAARRRKQPPR